MRRLAVRIEVRSAIAVPEWTQLVSFVVEMRVGQFIVLDWPCKMRLFSGAKWMSSKRAQLLVIVDINNFHHNNSAEAIPFWDRCIAPPSEANGRCKSSQELIRPAKIR